LPAGLNEGSWGDEGRDGVGAEHGQQRGSSNLRDGFSFESRGFSFNSLHEASSSLLAKKLRKKLPYK
jgi:hypothetical protein